MKNYLVAIYSGKNEKEYFGTDLVTADSISDAEIKVIGKKYFRDSDRTKILAICRKAIVIHEIN